MNAKNVPSSKLKGVRLTEQYGKIGIAAVEAAALYQRKGDKAKSIRSAKDPEQKNLSDARNFSQEIVGPTPASANLDRFTISSLRLLDLNCGQNDCSEIDAKGRGDYE